MPASVCLWPSHQVDDIWHLLGEGFQNAALKTGGDISAGDLWQGCRRGDCYLFIAFEDGRFLGATIFKPETWQTGVKFRCLAVFGTRFKIWKDDMRALVTKVAKDCGCTSLLTEGRKGWERVFPNAKLVRILLEEAI